MFSDLFTLLKGRVVKTQYCNLCEPNSAFKMFETSRNYEKSKLDFRKYPSHIISANETDEEINNIPLANHVILKLSIMSLVRTTTITIGQSGNLSGTIALARVLRDESKGVNG